MTTYDGRRIRKKWEKYEEENLIHGVDRFGTGRWKEILKEYEFEVSQPLAKVDVLFITSSASHVGSHICGFERQV